VFSGTKEEPFPLLRVAAEGARDGRRGEQGRCLSAERIQQPPWAGTALPVCTDLWL